jgi:hypothetical protein
MGLFVSNPARAFAEIAGANFSVAQHVIGHFRIVALWSFLTLPPHETGGTAHVVTQRPEVIEDPEEHLDNEYTMNGADEIGSSAEFSKACSHLINVFVGEHFGPLPEPFRTFFLECTKLIKAGRRDTAEWKAFREHVIAARDRLQIGLG